MPIALYCQAKVSIDIDERDLQLATAFQDQNSVALGAEEIVSLDAKSFAAKHSEDIIPLIAGRENVECFGAPHCL